MTDVTDNTTRAGASSFIVRVFDAVGSYRVSEIVLFAAIAVWLCFRMLSKTFFGDIFIENPILTPDFIRHRALLLLAFCELSCIWRGGYGKRDAVAWCVAAIMGWGLYSHGFIDALYDMLVVFVARRFDFRRVLIFATIVVSAIGAVVIVCSLAGVIPDVLLKQGGREHLRHCLGFTYCLFPAQYLFAVTCSICLLRDREMHWVGIIVLAALNVACFLLTWSRLSFGLSLLALVLVAARKLTSHEAFWKKLASVASWAFVAVVVVSVIAVGLYAVQATTGADWMAAANRISGGRIALSYRGIVDMGTSLMGQQVHWVGNGMDVYGNGVEQAAPGYNYVDNLFFHALIEFGWVYTIVLFALYTVASRKMCRNRDFFIAVIYGVLALHFLLDDLCLSIDFNVLLFALGPYLFNAGGARRRASEASALSRAAE